MIERKSYPADVVAIGQKQRERMRNPLPELPKILRRTPSTCMKRVKLNQSHVEILIPRDIDLKKKLKAVPRG